MGQIQNEYSIEDVIVVILNWNKYQDTILCINSLLENYQDKLNIHLFENGSDDESLNVLSRKYSSNNRVSIQSVDTNLGYAHGATLAIKKIIDLDPKVIWLLNNDTIVEKDSLNSLLKDLNVKNLDAVSSVMFYPDGTTVQCGGGGWINFWTGRGGNYKRLCNGDECDYMYLASVLIKSKVFRTIGFFDYKNFFHYWEDVDFSLRFFNQGLRWDICQESKITHKETGSYEPYDPALEFHYNKGMVRFFRKHSSYPYIPAFVALSLRVLKRLVKGRYMNIRFIIKGAIEGLS